MTEVSLEKAVKEAFGKQEAKKQLVKHDQTYVPLDGMGIILDQQRQRLNLEFNVNFQEDLLKPTPFENVVKDFTDIKECIYRLRKLGHTFVYDYILGRDDGHGVDFNFYIPVTSQNYLNKLCRDIKKVMAEETR